MKQRSAYRFTPLHKTSSISLSILPRHPHTHTLDYMMNELRWKVLIDETPAHHWEKEMQGGVICSVFLGRHVRGCEYRYVVYIVIFKPMKRCV